MKKIFLGLLACAGMWACTTDKETVGVDGSGEVISGGTAYLTVRIKDVGTTTRATDGGYGYGTADEHAVSDAYFYFYDDAGVYVSEAEVWNGDTEGDGTNANVEFEGNTVIVLKGLTTNNYPKYVVTVLNRPAGFTPGETLSVMASKLADDSGVGITRGSYFTMSTSSYVDTGSTTGDSRPAYFVTELSSENFSLEPIASDLSTITPVDIYVERLAAKVQVDISSQLSNSTTTFTDGTTGYRLTETVAGGDNTGTTEGDVDVYVRFTGWALNGTAKYSNIVKEIDATWTAEDLGFTWNIPTDYRSYWGKSFNYGLGYGQYPTTSGGATDGTQVDTYLDYVSYNDLTLTVGSGTTSSGIEYCAENTNTAGGESGVLQSKNSSAITNVLLAAVVCDANGNGLNLVRYNGLLFTESSYLDYVMSELTQLGELNVYTLDETTGVYTHIDGSYITLAKTDGTTTLYDGYVVVIPVATAFDGTTFYTSDGEEISDAYTTVLATLQAFNSDHTLTNAFTGGLMYYHIPIEHLNNTSSMSEDGTTVPLEANYGIVRNHWYSLTITSLDNLGKGVYDPDEVIIPGADDETYYVGADVNILSWKLVSQSVSL